jgi:CBS domain-containing protein
MTIGEICTRTVIIASRETLITEGARLMRERHTGDIIVTDEIGGVRIPVGIVTDRDLVMEVLAQEVPPEKVSLGDIMTLSPAIAKERDGIFETIQRMRSVGARRMPIVDDSGALVGIISLDDLIELIADELRALVGLMREERRREIETRTLA